MKKYLLLLVIMFPVLSFGQDGVNRLMSIVSNDTLVREGVLDSGIKYYLRQNKKDLQRADFYIVYDVGAVQEDDNQNGLAHFLEHMAFNGSKNFQGNSLIDYLQSIGVRFGENLNAGTGQETTTYMVTNVPVTRDAIVDSLLLVLHDWAGFINLDPKDIDEERGVIREEWRQRNSADIRIYEKQMPVIYNNSIYSKRNIIGNEEVLKSFTYDDIKSFYHKWYRPDMQAFVIVGDFDVDEMEAKLKKVMADIKPFDVKTPKAVVVVDNNEKPLVSVVTDPEAQSTDIQLIFRHEPLPKDYAGLVGATKREFLTSIVSSIVSERLYDIANKENSPFTNAGVLYMPMVKPFDAFYAYGGSKDGESIVALEAIYTELLRMQRGGATQSELDRAKANITSKKESEYNNRNDRRNAEFVYKYISNFIKNKPYPTPEYEFELTKEMLATIGLEEINTIAKALVRDENLAILISAPSSSIVPSEESILKTIEKVKASDIKVFSEDIAVVPLVDASKIKAGKVKKESVGKYGSTVWTLSNGVKVVVKPTDFKADQIVMKGSQFGGFSTVDSISDLVAIKFYKYFADNAGLGSFTQSELNKLLTGKIAYSDVAFSNFLTTINGGATPKDLESMLQLTYLRFMSPRFEQADLNVVLSQWKAIIPNMEKNPDYLFNKIFAEISTGGNKRVTSTIPSLSMLDAVSLDKMSNVYKKQLMNARNMTFVFTGNVDLKVLKPLVEKYLGSLPSYKEMSTYGKNSVDIVKGIVSKEVKLDMETPKVTVGVVYSGDADLNLEERINLKAISHILDVRYTKSIREEAGGTYGVWVDMSTDKLPHPKYELNIYFNTDASKVDELLPIIHKEIADMAASGVSAENLKIFKEFSAKKFAENEINNKIWVNYLEDFYLWDEDNYSNYLQKLESVTIESIKSTAEKIFSQKNVVTVVMLPN